MVTVMLAVLLSPLKAQPRLRPSPLLSTTSLALHKWFSTYALHDLLGGPRPWRMYVLGREVAGSVVRGGVWGGDGLVPGLVPRI
jgi:hypothetical protein